MRAIHQNQFNTPIQVDTEALNAFVAYLIARAKELFKPLRFDINLGDAVPAFVVATMASLASFLNRQTEGNGQRPKFSWWQLAAHLSASAVAALLSRAIAIELGVKSANVMTIIAGISGWASYGGVQWLIYAVKMRALMFAGLHKAADRERFNDPDQPERFPRRTGYSEDYDHGDEYPRANGPYRRKRETVEKDNENIPKD